MCSSQETCSTWTAQASTRKLTQYGMQLRSKQVVKRIYGVLERQFRRYFEAALRKSEETGSALVKILESRLDNMVFRMWICIQQETGKTAG